MKYYLTLTLFLAFVSIIGFKNNSAAEPINTTQKDSNPLPEIISIETSPQKIKNGWVCLPKEKGELEIKVNSINANKILIWLIPTGTNTWEYRDLLVEKEIKQDRPFTFIWSYPKKQILNHIQVTAFSHSGKQASSIFNVVNECKPE